MELFIVIILLFICQLCNADLLDKLQNIRKQSGHIESNEAASSYLDVTLWYNTTMQRLTYKPHERRFIMNKVNVLKFKYDDIEEEDMRTVKTTKMFMRRHRREVFGKDQRLHITRKYVNKYPFASVVRLENGCTGTIIWNQHVLTSAHCVHNHTDLSPPLNKIRIGLLDTDGSFTWFGASRVFVPPHWLKNKGMSYLNHDYAVIKLDKPHGRRRMPFGAYHIRENNYIQFAGFPSDKNTNQMWYSYCSVSQSLKHVFINHCDAAPGMSGSGVYVYNKNDVTDRKIVAVFSSYVQYKEYGGKNSIDYDANVATRLTKGKVNRICKWIGAGSDCYKLNFSDRSRYF